MSRNDIASRADLEALMKAFYSKALIHPAIGFFFTEVAPLQMETHIPLIVDFWETIVFGKAAYKGNVLVVHQHLHQRQAFEEAHFAVWVQLFQATVDELFEGDHATLVKQRAESIATVMRIKLLYGGIGLKK